LVNVVFASHKKAADVLRNRKVAEGFEAYVDRITAKAYKKGAYPKRWG